MQEGERANARTCAYFQDMATCIILSTLYLQFRASKMSLILST